MVDPTFDYHGALSACAQGDDVAFQRLYAKEAPRMLALANIMLGDQVAAQNAVHDAFVLIWKNADSFDARTGSARAWIYSIMRYRTLALLRQTGRRPGVPIATPNALSVNKSPPNGFVRALAKQPESKRKPILMAFYNGLDYASIATQLRIQPQELRNRVRICLAALQETDPA